MTQRVQKTLDNTQNAIEDGVDAVQTAVSHQADQLGGGTRRVEDLARAGIDKARAAGSAMASQARHLGDCTTGYVREKPAQALLMAAAAGAATTLLLGWAVRRRTH
jgi:ElaB/YqjD/DUF883 family membrane-anchored ribosome-binding protein